MRRGPRWWQPSPPRQRTDPVALFGPARPPGGVTRLMWRLVDLRFYLRAVIAVAVLGLVVVPSLADLTNAVLKTVQSAEGPCRILRVIDGDTVTLMCPGDGMQSARLSGFDTPEKYAPKCVAELVAAEKATWALRTLIQKADRIELMRDGTDQWGRALVRLTLDGQDVARRMVKTGHARTYGGGLRGSWC